MIISQGKGEKPKRQAISVVLLATLTLMLAGQVALAFDTGYHFDLTESALQQLGFGRDAIDIVKLENYFTDYFSAQPEWGGGIGEAKRLHFDNLFNTREVAGYWNGLVRNIYEAIQCIVHAQPPGCVRPGDIPLGFLTILGISLHMVQDFYSHANWAEIDLAGWGQACPSPSTTTWFDVSDASKRKLDIYTGAYEEDPPPGRRTHDEMNKDYEGRPYFGQAYQMAERASVQWVKMVESWVADPGFWNSVRNVVVVGDAREDLDEELLYANRLSNYAGHWKGPETEDTWALIEGGIEYKLYPDTVFIDQWKEERLFEWLTHHQYISMGRGYVTLSSRVPSYHFMSETYLDQNVNYLGDFCLGRKDRKLVFFANNSFQEGIIDLGDLGDISLADVTPPRVRNYNRFGVEVIPGHIYVIRAREWRAIRNYVMMKVLSAAGSEAHFQFVSARSSLYRCRAPEDYPEGTMEIGSSTDFSSRAYYGNDTATGDFYLARTRGGRLAFFANNTGQKGIVDLGYLPDCQVRRAACLALIEPPTSGYNRFGVEVVLGHTYVALAKEEGYYPVYIVFKVVGVTRFTVTIRSFIRTGP